MQLKNRTYRYTFRNDISTLVIIHAHRIPQKASVIGLQMTSLLNLWKETKIRDTLKLAIYGKGGIGKSTVSSNLSYAAASLGLRVLQIGCDPKCDSTRSLLGGRVQQTVTEYIRAVPPSKRRLEDVVSEGAGGVLCVEAGGPRPGVGCAGKGIISMFQTLKRMGSDSLCADMVVYDVLGDVVCGGFAVPMRPENSDIVLIVTSGEYMSLFAANNILKGALSFEDGRGRVAGIVLNRRGVADEDRLAECFSEAVGVPILCSIQRSELFSVAEKERRVLSEMFPDSSEAKSMHELVSALLSVDPASLVPPTPLTSEQMDLLYSSGTIEGRGLYRASPVIEKGNDTAIPVFVPPRRIGKGPVAAVMEGGKVMDIPVVIHGTASCGYTMLREISKERILHSISDPSSCLSAGNNVLCTNMDPESSVLGGSERLKAVLNDLAEDNPIMLVISTCLPGMIGDDCENAIEEVERSHPGARVLFVDANRVDSGFDAHLEVVRALSSLIDPALEPMDRFINVADDTFIEFNKGRNREYLSSLLAMGGLFLGPGFLDDCGVSDIVRAKRYGPAVLAEMSRDCVSVGRMLSEKGIRVMEHAVPRGLYQTLAWLEELSSIVKYDLSETAKQVKKEYKDAVSKYSAALQGRRATVVTIDMSLDSWIGETLSDCGCGVEFMTLDQFKEKAGQAKGFPDVQSLKKALDEMKSDLTIDCVGIAGLPCRMERPGAWATHLAAADLARRAYGMVMSSRKEGWRSWRD